MGGKQESQRSSKILARKWKILEDLGKKMKDPWRSWQENERSLKILARKWRILEDLNKNFEDPHEDPQEDPQRSSWRSCKILKDPWKIFTRDHSSMILCLFSTLQYFQLYKEIQITILVPNGKTLQLFLSGCLYIFRLNNSQRFIVQSNHITQIPILLQD